MKNLSCLLSMTMLSCVHAAMAGCGKFQEGARSASEIQTVATVDQVDSQKSKVFLAVETWRAIERSFSDKPIVVVDLWSLSCAPCLEAFPGLVRLQKDFPDKVNCVAVNVDFDGRESAPPESYVDKAKSFLEDTSASELTCFLASTASHEVLEDVSAVSIPTVMIYQNGKRVRTFVDADETAGFTYQSHVVPAVQVLIAGE